MLIGKFHSHITVESIEKEMVKKISGKLTVIDLQNTNKVQTDVMVTNHYVGAESDFFLLTAERADILANSGVKVKRVKIEYELFDGKSPKEYIPEALSRIYTEIHVKCLVKEENLLNLIKAAESLSWRASQNPFSKSREGVVQFLNIRFYKDLTQKKLYDAVEDIRQIKVDFEIRDIRYETAVYDNNENLDLNWINNI